MPDKLTRRDLLAGAAAGVAAALPVPALPPPAVLPTYLDASEYGMSLALNAAGMARARARARRWAKELKAEQASALTSESTADAGSS